MLADLTGLSFFLEACLSFRAGASPDAGFSIGEWLSMAKGFLKRLFNLTITIKGCFPATENPICSTTSTLWLMANIELSIWLSYCACTSLL